jgi:alpha-galactosidase
MKYLDGKVYDLNITYIGGGSRGWAWTFMTDLALEGSLSGTIRLYDIDSEGAKANQIIGNRISQRLEAVGKWNYEVYDDLEIALQGADFVVISILPGTFDDMAIDVHLPERLGIYQSVGDTTGPGGLMRALRAIPDFLRFGEAIKLHAPKAWVINYTNPMSLCIQALYHAFPGIKAFGWCHEVFGTQELLKEMVEEQLGITGVNRHEIHVNVLGINHFTWFDHASYQGIDLFPVYIEFVNKYYEVGFRIKGESPENDSFVSAQRVKFDLFKKYGLIAAAGDRHLAEFVSGALYLKDPETVAKWMFGLTTVSWRKENLDERMKKSVRLVNGEEEIELVPTGEEGILLIKALCGLKRVISNVNIPNTSLQISNLPSSAIVETNAVFELGRIRPIVAGRINKDIQSLIMPHVENQKLILEAALTYNKELVIRAFKADPLIIGRNCNKEEVNMLVDDMIAKTANGLPEGWRV